MMEFRKGLLTAVSKSDCATDKLLNAQKNILYIDNAKRQYVIKTLKDEYYLTLEQSALDMLNELEEFDVVEFYSENKFRIIYNAGPDGATLFVTNKCNSNCIMCPCSELFRQKNDIETVEHLCSVIEYLPDDIHFITITGGEPTLIRESMFILLEKICNHFQSNTQFLLLTNGRSFSVGSYLNNFIKFAPDRLLFGIPIYGYSSETHDYITQAPGSFVQTVKGLKNLLRYGQKIELRIVVSKLNLSYMDHIAKFIVRELKGVSCVNIMATEMCGAAAKNHSIVWVDYKEAFQASKNAIQILVKSGIDVSLYNFPLCKVDKGYWGLCHKSISDYKISYYDSCQKCSVKDLCGGVFRSTLALTKMELSPFNC